MLMEGRPMVPSNQTLEDGFSLISQMGYLIKIRGTKSEFWYKKVFFRLWAEISQSPVKLGLRFSSEVGEAIAAAALFVILAFVRGQPGDTAGTRVQRAGSEV